VNTLNLRILISKVRISRDVLYKDALIVTVVSNPV
jgi:hypothetical protein